MPAFHVQGLVVYLDSRQSGIVRFAMIECEGWSVAPIVVLARCIWFVAGEVWSTPARKPFVQPQCYRRLVRADLTKSVVGAEPSTVIRCIVGPVGR